MVLRINIDSLKKTGLCLKYLISKMQRSESTLTVIFANASICFENVKNERDVFQHAKIKFADEEFVLECSASGSNGSVYKLYSNGFLNTTNVVKIEYTPTDKSEDIVLEEKQLCNIMKGEYIGCIRVGTSNNNMCHIHKLEYAEGDFLSFIEYQFDIDKRILDGVMPFGFDCLHQIYAQYLCLRQYGYFYSDLKIENILVDSFSDPKRFFLGDFGAVRGQRTHISPWTNDSENVSENEFSFYFAMLCLNVLFPYVFNEDLNSLFGQHNTSQTTKPQLKIKILSNILGKVNILGKSFAYKVIRTLQLESVNVSELYPTYIQSSSNDDKTTKIRKMR